MLKERACVFLKWLEMVLIPLWGLVGSFKVHICFAARFGGKPVLFAMPQQDQVSYFKQAHVGPERLKEE
jgi:hypothetical protein